MTLRLKARFFLSHTAVALVALACAALVFLAGARLALERQWDKGEAQQLDAFALAAHEASLDRQPLEATDFMRAALKQPGVAFAAFQDSDGLAWTLPAPPPKGARSGLRASGVHDVTLAGLGPVRFRAREYAARRSPGRVAMAWSLPYRAAALDSRMRALAPALALALASALALGTLAAGAVARQLARPLAELRGGVLAVRQGRLSEPVQVRRGDEIGDLARDFNRMTVELAELDGIKRDFVNGVTHDLGTPLHAMRASVNFLQSGKAGPLTDSQSDYLLILSNATELLRQFLDNLLTAARIEAGKVEPFREPLDPAKEIEDIVRLYEPQAEERGLALELEPTLVPLTLNADRLQFRQMALNLLTNAFKFTDRGTITVGLRHEEGWLRLQVSDTGIGIEEKYQELIFDKFFRVRQPEGGPERKGTGLGLAIARGLAKAHGGSLEVFSRPAQGSTFTLRLPGARRAA